MKKGHQPPLTPPKVNPGPPGTTTFTPPLVIIEIRKAFSLKNLNLAPLGDEISYYLLDNINVDTVLADRKTPSGSELNLIGMFAYADDKQALASQRQGFLEKLDLVSPDPGPEPNLPPPENLNFPCGFLISLSALQMMADSARNRVPQDPHFDILDITLTLHQPATVIIQPAIYVRAVPGIPIIPGVTETTIAPRIRIGLNTHQGKIVADKVDLRSTPLDAVDIAFNGIVSKALDMVINSMLAKLPDQFLIPETHSKFLVDATGIACNPETVPGPDHDGTVPAGLRIEGFLTMTARKPAVHIIGPATIHTDSISGAHGLFRVVTEDLRQNTTVNWTSDGVVTTPDHNATTIGWPTFGDKVGSRIHHTVSVRIEDADGIVVKTSLDVIIVVEPPIRLPGKPSANPGLEIAPQLHYFYR